MEMTVARQTRYLIFTLLRTPPARWSVQSIHGAWLGEIRWYGRWRQYVFYPSEETIFNPDCLDDIAAFARERTTEHREKANS